MHRLIAASLIAASLNALAATLPAAAFDMTAMTAEETDAFRAQVRAYLLENPEVLMEAIAVLEERRAAEQVGQDEALIAANAAALLDDGYSFVGGNPDGDVTVVEFLDYRCGYCKKAHPEVTALIRDDGNIRYIIKEFPILGEQSVLAARFAIAVKAVAGDDSYAAVHDELMGFRGDITAESLSAMALRQGLDEAAVMAEMMSESTNAIISGNHALAAALQINGTPGFVIGPQMLRGYVPHEGMVQIVAQVRSE